MCTSYRVEATGAQLTKRFGASPPPGWTPAAGVVVGTAAPVLIAAPERRFSLLRFGLKPSWAGEDAKTAPNARAESLADKPYFRDAFRLRRCLVPAAAWLERPKRGADKSPRRLALADGALFAFAGVWEPGCFAVVTVEPNALVRAIHDRMPALLAPGDEAAWLDPKTPPSRLAELLRPYPAERLSCRHDEASPQGDLFG
ncbi:MAG: SOS response-associated peptidase [Elusimicrobiota bacterium]|nr:SOS response-associated peptidase [Elusimicrobiota bacterium]